jgi:hypothetical protein
MMISGCERRRGGGWYSVTSRLWDAFQGSCVGFIVGVEVFASFVGAQVLTFELMNQLQRIHNN